MFELGLLLTAVIGSFVAYQVGWQEGWRVGLRAGESLIDPEAPSDSL